MICCCLPKSRIPVEKRLSIDNPQPLVTEWLCTRQNTVVRNCLTNLMGVQMDCLHLDIQMQTICLDPHQASQNISDHCVIASTKQQYLLVDKTLFVLQCAWEQKNGSIFTKHRSGLPAEGQDHHENWTSNQLPVPFHTVHDTLCQLQYEAGLFIMLQEKDFGVGEK